MSAIHVDIRSGKIQTYGLTVSDDSMLKNLDAQVFYNKKCSEEYKQRFLLKSGNSLIPVRTDQIAYFFKDEIVFAKTFDKAIYPVEES